MFKKIIITIFLIVLMTIQNGLTSKAFASHDKPLVVEITTDWCFACKLLKPIMEEIKNEFSGQVTFISLNLTNEDTTKEAERIAAENGVLEFLNNNKNAFPRVGIFCSNTSVPEKNILGSATKETYKTALDGLLASYTCSLSNNFTVADSNIGRPEEAEFIEIAGSRPDVPAFLERPREMNSSGRPDELTFWTYGQQVPTIAYLQYWVLPQCAGSNQYICGIQAAKDTKPVFKPWTPDATRNEKGFKFVNKS